MNISKIIILKRHIQNIFFYFRAGSKIIIIYKYLTSLIIYKIHKNSNLQTIRQIEKRYLENPNLNKISVNSKVLFWLSVFRKEKTFNKNPYILEIGAYEGRTSAFFLTFFRKSTMTAVDTWEGSDEHHKKDFLPIEEKFNKVCKAYKKRLKKHKTTSLSFLTSYKKKRKFDLIYIDASHKAEDVLLDALLVWQNTSIGGIIIFDDYNWIYYKKILDNTIGGINNFLSFYKGKYKILCVSTQLIIKKISE